MEIKIDSPRFKCSIICEQERLFVSYASTYFSLSFFKNNISKIDSLEIDKEIEAIINSGTKINIDYYIDQTVDEDNVDEIYDYFYESETGSIIDAIEELGEENFSEEEIRLVRIKFLSEMAN